MGLYIHFVQPFCHKVLRHYIHSFALGFAPFCTLLNTLASTVHGSECCNQFNCSSPSQCCAVFKYFRGSNGTTKILYLKIIKPELFQSQKSGSMTCMHAHTHMHTGIHTYIHTCIPQFRKIHCLYFHIEIVFGKIFLLLCTLAMCSSITINNMHFT